MRKVLNFFSIVGKISLLLVLLLFGWIFINVSALMKGKKTESKEKTANLDNLFKDTFVHAEDCSTTPYIAVHDGKEYKIENDFLFGRPRSYHANARTAQLLHERGYIHPDLYKITMPVTPFDDTIKMQIQEIELEESFFKWIKLKRVVHSQNTEVVVDSEFGKYYVLETNKLSQSIVLPEVIQGDTRKPASFQAAEAFSSEPTSPIAFSHNEVIEFEFKGLSHEHDPALIVNSWHRDWQMGLVEDWGTKSKFLQLWDNRSLRRAAVALPALVLADLFLGHHGMAGGATAAVPFLMGDCPSIKSFHFEFKNESGEWKLVTITEPRAWKFNTEVISFPREAVDREGAMRIRVTATKRHTLGFIGAFSTITSLESASSEEILPLVSARHERTSEDFTELLNDRKEGYMNTIPGDTVDLEFGVSSKKLRSDQKETYLIQASGFYTALSRESRKKIGNWEERLSPEAKERLTTLVPLNDYR